jgi:hypothetical protein
MIFSVVLYIDYPTFVLNKLEEFRIVEHDHIGAACLRLIQSTGPFLEFGLKTKT